MHPETLDLLLHGLALAFWLALPIALSGAAAGLLSGLLRSFTAWSDPALTYVPRALAVVLAWALAAPFIAREVLALARSAWSFGA